MADPNTVQLEWYPVWPKFGGKAITHQWGEIRQNQETLAPIVRAVGFDPTFTIRKNAAVQGWEIGEDGFHNRYRQFWDDTNSLWKLQRNTGTVGTPVWETVLASDSSGNLTDKDGGTIGGVAPGREFYGINVKQSDDAASFKGIETLNFEADNFSVTQTAGDTDVADISFSGTSGGTGFYGITVKQTDDLATFKGINVVAFHASDFYLTQNDPNTDESIVNLRSDVTSEFATRELDNLRNTAVNADVLPGTDETYDLGSKSLRFAETHSSKVYAVDGGATFTQTYGGLITGYGDSPGTIQSTNKGSFVGGRVTGVGTSLVSSEGLGSFAFGMAKTDATVASGTLKSSGYGSFAAGYVRSYGESVCEATTPGSFAQGYTIANNANSVVKIQGIGSGAFAQGAIADLLGATISIISDGIGSFAQGACNITGAGGIEKIHAKGTGSFAQGSVISSGTKTSYIYSSGVGSFAQGYVTASGSSYAYLQATGAGASAIGFVRAQVSTTATFQATNAGSIVLGRCSATSQDATLEATGLGAFAGGNVKGGRIGGGGKATIRASGNASFAFGYADGRLSDAIIEATAENSFQLGPGRNTTRESLQIMNKDPIRWAFMMGAL